MQYLSIKITCFFLRLSIVRILSRATGYAKKSRLRRSVRPPYTLLKKVTLHRASQRAKEGPDNEQSFFGGDPPQPIFTTSSGNDRVQHLEKKKKKSTIEAYFAQAIPNKT